MRNAGPRENPMIMGSQTEEIYRSGGLESGVGFAGCAGVTGGAAPTRRAADRQAGAGGREQGRACDASSPAAGLFDMSAQTARKGCAYCDQRGQQEDGYQGCGNQFLFTLLAGLGSIVPGILVVDLSLHGSPRICDGRGIRWCAAWNDGACRQADDEQCCYQSAEHGASFNAGSPSANEREGEVGQYRDRDQGD